MGSELGITDEKIDALHDYETSPLYAEAERAALDASAVRRTGVAGLGSLGLDPLKAALARL